MKGVRLLGNCQVQIADLPDPTPQPDEAVIRVTASGVCGSELGGFRGPKALPSNNGHEVAGIVEDPNGHTEWKAGDRVGVFTLQGCGECRWCRKGWDDLCPSVRPPKATHSQLTCSRARSLVRLDDLEDMEVDAPLAVLFFGDGMGVPFGASTRAQVGPGDITCVLGCGPVGLGMVLLQTFLGARVIAVEVNPVRLELAQEFGAWKTLNPSETDNIAQTLRDLTGGIGPQKCFEAAGRQETLDLALEATAPEGLIVQVGQGPIQLNPNKLIGKRNLTIKGNWICHPGECPRLLEMQRKGLRAERLITAAYPFTEAQQAFQEAADGKQAKIILTYGIWPGS